MNKTSETADPDVDPEIMRRAQSGDETAFGSLVRGHYERIFRLVFSILRNEEDARDVCQEVWVTVWRRLSSFQGRSRFTTWLHPIAVRKAIDRLRNRKRRFQRFLPMSRDDPESEIEPVEWSDPRSRLEGSEQDGRFKRALSALPSKHRAVLALREVEGLSYEEIAKTLKCRPGTVMSRLYHARRLLARRLGEMPCE